MAVMRYLSRPTLNNHEAPVVKDESPAAPTAPSCYPGLSRKVERLGSAAYFPPGAFYPRPEQEACVVEW
jgi:hypothetical protein